jgi:hypothetical protein
MANLFLRTMTNRLLYFVLIILSLTHKEDGQALKNGFTADSIFIYDNFKKGGTTASLSHNHKDLESAKPQKSKLSSGDMADFIDIFKKTKAKKLFQQKYGAGLCYILVFKDGIRSKYVLYSSADIGILDNLDLMRRWTVTETADKKRLYEQVQKNWHNNVDMP